MSSSPDKVVDLKHYARVVGRRKGILILCTVTTLCAAAVALVFVPKIYESQVTMMIEDNQLLSVELEKVMGGIMQPSGRYNIDQERMSKLVGRIRSRPFLERVIRILKMTDDPSIRSRAAEQRRHHPELTEEEVAIRILVKNLQSRISFAGAGIGVYKVSVADYSAENAQLLARWISELFVDVSNEETIDRIKSGRDFGAEQLHIYEERLHRAEEALERYKQSMIQQSLAKSLVRDDNRTTAEALYQRIQDEASGGRIRLKQNLANLSALGVGENHTIVLDDARVRDLGDNLARELRSEVTDRLAGRTGEAGDWPPPGNYTSLRRGLLEEVERVAQRYFAGSDPEVARAVARAVFSRIDLDAQEEAASTLAGAISDYKRRAESSPGGELTLTRLESEVDNSRRLLQSFQAQLVASDVSQAVEATKLGMQIEILDPADLPLSPSRPSKWRILLGALFLGPLLGIAFTGLSELLDPTLRTLEDFARAAPETVLGTTPLLSRLTNRRTWFSRYWIPATMTGIILLTAVLFLVRDNVLHTLLAAGQPVHMVSPENDPNEDTR